MEAGGSPKRKCAEKKIEAPSVGDVPRSNRRAAPAKPSSLCGPHRLNLKAEVQPHWVGEACSDWGRQMFPRRNPLAFNRVSVGVVSLCGSGSEQHGGRKTLQRRQAAAPQQALGLRST